MSVSSVNPNSTAYMLTLARQNPSSFGSATSPADDGTQAAKGTGHHRGGGHDPENSALAASALTTSDPYNLTETDLNTTTGQDQPALTHSPYDQLLSQDESNQLGTL